MKKFRIGLIAGDGIGPEITDAARVLTEMVFQRWKPNSLVWKSAPVGWEAIKKQQPPLPNETLKILEKCDGWIMGPHDSASYPKQFQQSLNPSGSIRKHFDLFSNIRPAKRLNTFLDGQKSLDLVIVRENTEGFYADRNMFKGIGEFMPDPNTAMAVGVFTRRACERIARSAFELAMTRNKKVSIVHKANVLKLTHGLFLESCRKISDEFPEVAVNDFHMDAMAALLVRQPEEFDVIVTTNMFGDILSDLGAELAGSLGLGASLNAGEDYAMAQAAHGSAPDLAGKNKANPCGLILSVAMLLHWLAMRHQEPELMKAAETLEKSVYRTLISGVKTPDLGGVVGTRQFTASLIKCLCEYPS